MSFFFVNQSKRSLKMTKGHQLLCILSLQLKNITADYHFKYATNFSLLKSPKYFDGFVSIFCKAKRTFLSARLSGSVTVEAAIALPLFIFAMISIIYFFNLLYIQMIMEVQLENTARIISTSTCITTAADANLNDEENSILEKVVIDTAGTIAISSIFVTEDIREFANNSLIVNGADGLSFIGSDMTNTDYPLSILLTYKVRMPFVPENVFTFDIVHRCYFKAFNGKELKNNLNLRNIYVYVAENGTVFHQNKLCSHLERYTQLNNEEHLKVEYPNIKLCAFCSQNTNLFSRPQINGISYVYVTSEYDAYHITDTCPYLQRHLIRLNYEDACEIYSPCDRCVAYDEK